MWTDDRFGAELFGPDCRQSKNNVELVKRMHADMTALIEEVESKWITRNS